MHVLNIFVSGISSRKKICVEKSKVPNKERLTFLASWLNDVWTARGRTTTNKLSILYRAWRASSSEFSPKKREIQKKKKEKVYVGQHGDRSRAKIVQIHQVSTRTPTPRLAGKSTPSRPALVNLYDPQFQLTLRVQGVPETVSEITSIVCQITCP
jgi:hypothetical protein